MKWLLQSMRVALLVSLALAIPRAAHADLNVSSVSTITFGTGLAGVVADGGYAGAGFSPAPASGSGRLDSNSWAINRGGGADLEFGGTRDSGVYARGQSGGFSGAVSDQGFYAFDVGGGNIAFGVQPGGGGGQIVFASSGTLTLRVKNTSGGPVNAWGVSYDIFTFNDTDKSHSIAFSYSTTDTNGIGNSGLYSTPELSFSSPTTADVGPIVWSAATTKATTVNVTVPNNEFLYLRWTFSLASASGEPYDQLALDNITVGITAIPEPAAVLLGMAACGVTGLGVAGRRLARRILAGRRAPTT